MITIPYFYYRDNSVHLLECSPFWVGIFITFNKENYPNKLSIVLCRHAHSDWQHIEAFLYVICYVLCKHGNLLLSLTLKHNFKLVYYNIVKIPTNKGAYSYKLKLSKIMNKLIHLFHICVTLSHVCDGEKAALNLKGWKQRVLLLLKNNTDRKPFGIHSTTLN